MEENAAYATESAISATGPAVYPKILRPKETNVTLTELGLVGNYVTRRTTYYLNNVEAHPDEVVDSEIRDPELAKGSVR